MPLACSSIVGAICIEPLGCQSDAWPSDDSSLERALASYAHSGVLGSEPELRLVASTRLSRLGGLHDSALDVRANLAQLLDDLQAEYDHLADRLSD